MKPEPAADRGTRAWATAWSIAQILLVAAVWILYVLVHVVLRWWGLPFDAALVALAFVLHRRGRAAAQIVNACTLLAAVFDAVGVIMIWLIVLALGHALGRMFGVVVLWS